MQIICDRVSSDYLNVDTSNPVEVYLTMQWSREQPEVLLTDRAKVAAIRDCLSEWLAAGHPSEGETLARWWGLSYASWLTLPRVLMQAMPAEWQERAGVLLEEYSSAFPNTPDLTVGVTVRGPDGKLVTMPAWLNNYRHPNRAEIDKCRGVE